VIAQLRLKVCMFSHVIWQATTRLRLYELNKFFLVSKILFIVLRCFNVAFSCQINKLVFLANHPINSDPQYVAYAAGDFTSQCGPIQLADDCTQQIRDVEMPVLYATTNPL